MEDWSDTPIYAQMMAEQERMEEIEQLRATEPVYAQMLEDTLKKEKLMENWQRSVLEMREAMDLPNAEFPRTLSPEEAELHIQMIRDEFEKEFVPAFRDQDIVEMADAGVDVLVYVIGALTNAGFDIDPLFREVMRSNMSKFDPETGKAIKAGPNDPSGEPEGKVLKGAAYSPPNLHPIINDTFRYGKEDNSVYRTTKTPITLGDGTIGECDVVVDHNGLVTVQGKFFDWDGMETLPEINGLGFYSVGHISEDEEPPTYDNVDVPPRDQRTINGHAPVPEGWVDPYFEEAADGEN